MSPFMSVVVPTYKRRDMLARCVAALQNQTLEADGYEIIVADDAADPNIEKFLAEMPLAKGPAPRYIPVIGRHGPAAARNHGWRSARGEIIAFTDDDCIPKPGWLRAAHDAFLPEIAAAWGALEMPLPSEPTDYELNASLLSKATFVTANAFCRRSVLESVGGFDEAFLSAWREDSDLFFRLLQGSHRVAFIPDAAVTHPIRPAKWGVSLEQTRKSIYDALLFKKHPKHYREWVGAAPWNYYLIVAAGLAGMIGAWRQQPILVWSGLAVWAALTAEFCYRRLRGTSRRWAHVAEMLVTSALIPPIAIFWRLAGALKYRVAFF